MGTESVETLRGLGALDEKIITVGEYQSSKPEPSIDKFEKERERFRQEN